jgi:hypothetical protein
MGEKRRRISVRSYSHLRSQEKSACMRDIQATIGRQLRAEYDLVQVLPDRLTDLLRQLGQETADGESKSDQA